MRSKLPPLIVADLEGVFMPEAWIAVAKQTGIEALMVTTREVADYNELMAHRIRELRTHGLTLADLQAIIRTLDPMEGAVDFMDWIRTRSPLIILTDSFYEFVAPFMPKLHFPTIFAHQLLVDDAGMLTGFRLRVADSKRTAVRAFNDSGFRTLEFGDSYNDTTMLAVADRGLLFRPPANVIADFPQYSVATEYRQLRTALEEFLAA